MKVYISLIPTLFMFAYVSAQTLTFEFTSTYERNVTIGKAAPDKFAEPMDPKLISLKENVLTITTVSTGKQYSIDKVLRVIEFKKENTTQYALEVKDKSGVYCYYLYILRKSPSGESKSLVVPYMVDGRFIMEQTYIAI